MADSIADRIRVMNALDYAAEVGARAGHDTFPIALTSAMTREAGHIHEAIARDLYQLSATDADRANTGAAALDAMRTATRQLARLHLAAKACLNTPTSTSAGEAVRAAYDTISTATDTAQAEQLTAMRALMSVHAGIVTGDQ